MKHMRLLAAPLSFVLLAVGCDDSGSSPEQEAPEPDAGATFDVGEMPPPEDAGRAPLDVAVTTPPPDMDVPDVGPRPDVAQPPPEILAVETRLGSPSTEAGLANRVTCEALDAEGVAVPDIRSRVEIRPDSGWRYDADDPDDLVGEVAGTYSVTCTLPNLGLRDGTPARWDVLAGPPVVVRARVSPVVMEAGGTAKVACQAFDVEGNPVPSVEADIEVGPANAGVEVIDRDVRITTAGRYRVDCSLPGARSEGEATLLVQPGLPAQLVAAVEPALEVHDVGAVVGFNARVTDVYGNPVSTADVRWGAAPELPRFGEGRYRPAAEGRYTLRVHVEGETFEDRELEVTEEILVDAGGPAIGCTLPVPGSMIGLGPTQLEGRVNDVAGIDRLSIDGQDVPLAEDGRFSVRVEPEWGLNVHQLTARDQVGNANSVFCSYFAADRYVPEDATLDDAILLHLSQTAMDDGAPSRPITSLTDLLRSMLDAPELVETLDRSLRAQNPVVPNECRQRVLGLCVLRAGAEYRGMRINGPNTITARLVHGGLRVNARIENIALDVRMLGTLSNSGTITARHIAVDLTFAVGLRNGRPDLRLERNNGVDVGRLDSDFDGFLTGGILDLVFGAFENTIRNEVADQIERFVESEVDALLSDVLSGLDLDALGLGFEVPSLGDDEPIPLSLGVDFSRMDANPMRLQIGISSTVNGPSRQGGASAGVPMPPGPVRIELRPNGSVGGAIHVGLLNQLLHRLWRAGMFEIGDAGAALGDLPDGANIGLRVLVPPALIGTGEGAEVRLFLGPAVGELFYPGFFDEPLRIRLAATAVTAVALEGETLSFGGEDGVQIETLYLMIEGQALDNRARATLERDIRRILQRVIDVSLNDALPELPIPDFALPDSLAEFGVPRGTRIGLRDAALSSSESHFTLDGRFGE